MSTPWGRVPVVAITDLIALKLTRRLGDYDVISNLVRVRLPDVERRRPALLRWAMMTSFRAEDRVEFAAELGLALSAEDCCQEILAEIARYQAQDVSYWSRVIDDLRDLRARKRLLLEGTPVAELLPSSTG